MMKMINSTKARSSSGVMLISLSVTRWLRWEKGLELNLPKLTAQPDKQIRKEDIQTVEIDPRGVYSIKKRPMKLDQLIAQLVQDFKYNPNLVIYIRADENSRTKELAALIDGCNRNGLTRYSLRTTPPGK